MVQSLDLLIDPLFGVRAPAMIFSNVDFPFPFNPIKPIRSPDLITAEAFS